jgi:hypothetical protein
MSPLILPDLQAIVPVREQPPGRRRVLGIRRRYNQCEKAGCKLAVDSASPENDHNCGLQIINLTPVPGACPESGETLPAFSGRLAAGRPVVTPLPDL